MSIKSGIYKIINSLNNKEYIGSAVDLERRHYYHLLHLRRNKHHSNKLQRAYNKYGKENFKFEVIEEVFFNSSCTTSYKTEYLQCLEQFYLDKFLPYKNGYNISKMSDCPNSKKSKETIKKTLETKRKNGYIVSQETKDNISKALKNSIKYKAAQKRMAANRVLKVYQYDLDGNFIKEFKSKVEASIELKISLRGLQEVVQHNNHTLGGFIFKNFKEDKIEPFIRTNYIKINVFDKNKSFLKTFDSISQCSKDLKINALSISRYAKIKKIYKDIFWFEFV